MSKYWFINFQLYLEFESVFHYCPVFIPLYVYMYGHVCVFLWLCVCVCMCVLCIDTVAIAKPSRTPTRRRCITRMVTVCLAHFSIITNNRLDSLTKSHFHPCLIKFILRANNFHQALSDYRRIHSLDPACCVFFHSLCLLFFLCHFSPLSSGFPCTHRWRGSDAMLLSFSNMWPNANVVYLSVIPRCEVLYRPTHVRGPLPGGPRVCQRNWSFQDQNRENHWFR